MLAKLKADGSVRSTWSWTYQDGNISESQETHQMISNGSLHQPWLWIILDNRYLSVEFNSWTTSSAAIEIAKLKCISNHLASSAKTHTNWVWAERIFMAKDLCVSWAIMSKDKPNQLRLPPWCCGLSWTFCESHTCAWATDKDDKDGRDCQGPPSQLKLCAVSPSGPVGLGWVCSAGILS